MAREIESPIPADFDGGDEYLPCQVCKTIVIGTPTPRIAPENPLGWEIDFVGSCGHTWTER